MFGSAQVEWAVSDRSENKSSDTCDVMRKDCIPALASCRTPLIQYLLPFDNPFERDAPGITNYENCHVVCMMIMCALK